MLNDKIAIVGLGALFPDAENFNQFWENILNKKVSIKELPNKLFEKEIYYRPDLIKSFNKQNKSVTKIAGFIDNIQFETVRKFKIPPSVSEHMDQNQHAALFTAEQALSKVYLKNIAKERISVIFGNGSVGAKYGDAIVGVQFEKFKYYLKKHNSLKSLSDKELEELFHYLKENALNESITLTEDSAPGILPNIIAARISNVFDFHGPSYTVDSACASALTAVISGIKGLRLNEFDVAVCGGADMPIKSLGLILFSAINALSPDGSFPFDERANGFVMGQGSGTVVLKRLEDAIRDNDTIYSVITGYGEASDGKGKYIAAPNADWQAYSIEKACQMAGYHVDTIEFIEAHGTGTSVGDLVEIEGLKKAFKNLGSTKTNYCGLSSVKSNIGHLKSAAGIAGLLKAVLSLHYKRLPPVANLKKVNPKLNLDNSPFYIIDDNYEWKSNNKYPRRANVSAFGFGGADYHLTLEEYSKVELKNFIVSSKTYSQDNNNNNNIINSLTTNSSIQQKYVSDSNIFFFSGDSYKDLQNSINEFSKSIKDFSSKDLTLKIYYHNLNTSVKHKYRLAILANSISDLNNKIDYFNSNHQKTSLTILTTKGIFFRFNEGVRPSQIAILFPGQASQYLNMFKYLRNNSEVFARYFDLADAFWYRQHGHTVSSLIFNEFVDDILRKKLNETQNTHPTVFVTSFALYKYLKNLGLEAGYMIGHSLGEITALAASNMISYDDGLNLVDARGYSFFEADLLDKGKMISLSSDFTTCKKIINESNIKGIAIANVNSKNQIIVSGNSNSIDKFKVFLDKNRVANLILPVSHAFHHSLMKPVSDLFENRLKNLVFKESQIEVMVNHKACFYRELSANISNATQILSEQILSPVNFVSSIEKLYSKGVKLFLEVGPNSILGSLTKNILEDKDVTVLSTNFKNVDEIQSLQKFSCALFAEGIKIYPLVPTQNNSKNIGQFEEVNHLTKTIKNTNFKDISVVYSGVSIGLPGSYKKMFSDDNFDQIFDGRNFIERLSDEEKQKLVDLQITKLIKESNTPTFKLLSSLDDVIQLAGKIGKIDLLKDYLIEENELKKLTSTISIGIAAAYEALKDAHIPLIQEFTKTSSGKLLPGKLTLPKYMQHDTGVIFANGFPMVDPIIEEVSKFIAYKFGSKTANELISFYESIIGQLKDRDVKKILTDWFTLFYTSLTQNFGDSDVYKFNYNFMMQISSQANNRIAQLLNAKGPNFQINAACSSTSNAVAIGEDFIRTGRVKRMIIVGADDPTSKNNLPFLGAGFLATGAATSENDLYKSAVPFDIKRNGMIMSSGAVGIILEEKEEVKKRGVIELCDLLGSHSFNTANHPSQIDSQGFSDELEVFFNKMMSKYNLDKNTFPSQTIYISHETYTPPRGGCSQTEAIALEKVFNESAKHFIVGNTKGMTGHAMGAALEEAVAAKALQFGKIPPVVNLSQLDPAFNSLNISKGGEHDRIFALRMSAGFGAQGNYILLKKVANGKKRIFDENIYQDWLNKISNSDNSSTNLNGRILVCNEQSGSFKDNGISKNLIYENTIFSNNEHTPIFINKSEISENKIIDSLSSITNYPAEMLEPEMELLADLGFDKSKQYSLVESLSKIYNFEINKLEINDKSTISDIVAFINNLNSSESLQVSNFNTESSNISNSNREYVKEAVIKVFSEITKYPSDMLDLDMEMEADLGIDTVKQATILSMIGEKFLIPQDETIKLSDYPTIGHILNLVYKFIEVDEKENKIHAPEKQTQNFIQDQNSDRENKLLKEILEVFAEVTKYPVDMLDLNMKMEADLGIDTVKQATILSILGEKYLLNQNEEFKLSDFATIGSVVELIKQKGNIPFNNSNFNEVEINNYEIDHNDYKDEAIYSIESELSRQIPILVTESLKGGKKSLKNKNILIIGNIKTTNNKLSKALFKTGATIFSYELPNLIDTEKLENNFNKILADVNPNFILDTTFIEQKYDTQFSKHKSIDHELFTKVKARFLFYKNIESKKYEPTKIICLTSIDGTFGIESELNSLDPAFDALRGFYKALRKEWSKTSLKIIDFSPTIIKTNYKFFANSLINELEKNGSNFEIAYKSKTRKVIKIDDQEINPIKKIKYDYTDTFVISGGALGIAFQITKALAKKFNSKFILIGRTEIPTDFDKLLLNENTTKEEIKDYIKNRLSKIFNHVSPKMIIDEYNKTMKIIQLLKNLKELDGVRFNYISADVRDYSKLKSEIAKAKEKFGAITAFIHGAGIDKSHFLKDKTLDEFNSVFDTKVKGAIYLGELLRDEPLKLVTALSSISGIFGNSAQIDYSAANSYLNSWVKNFKLIKPGLNAFSFITSGWKDIGMAWENDLVRTSSEELGLNLIDINLGTACFINEIESFSNDSDIIIHKGLNGFMEEGLSMSKIENYPLIDRVITKNKEISKAYRVISVKRDSFVDQHRLGEVPILPAVAYSEIAAEFYALATNYTGELLFKEISFENPFKLFNENSRELYVEGSKSLKNEEWNIEIKSNFKTKISQINQPVLHSKTLLSNSISNYSDMIPEKWNFSKNKSQFLAAEESLLLIKGNGPKQRIILGPLFNDIIRDRNDKAAVEIFEDGVIYPAKFPLAQLTDKKYQINKLIVNPCFLDTMYQACAAYLLVTKKKVYLPYFAKDLGIISAPKQKGNYICFAKVVEEGENYVKFKVSLLDENRNIRYFVRSIEFRKINL